MRINISTLMEFKRFRAWFKSVNEFSIIVEENSFTVISQKGGLTHVVTIPAEVAADVPLPLGFSFFSSILLNLPVKNKGLDELRITISQSNVTLDLNGRIINVMFTHYNPNTLASMEDTDAVSAKLNLNEFNWLFAVSKFYRDDNIQMCKNLAYMDTQDGIYYTKLEKEADKSFSFVPALMNRARPNTEVFLSNKLEIKNKPYRTFSSLYKISPTIADTVDFARTQKSKIKVTLSSWSNRLVIKGLRAASFETSFADNNIAVTTKDNEKLQLPYDKAETHIATSDFERFAKMSDILAGVKLNGYAVHQLIANEKKVHLFITPYANILKFDENCYLILRGGL